MKIFWISIVVGVAIVAIVAYLEGQADGRDQIKNAILKDNASISTNAWTFTNRHVTVKE